MTITRCQTIKKSLIKLYIDGEPAVDIDKEVFLLSPYKEGSIIDDEELKELIYNSSEKRCKQSALYYLERKRYTKRDLENKLASLHYDRELCKSTVDNMERLGLLNDADYANVYTADLINLKKYGKVRIKTELYRKGIDKEIIDNVLETIEDNDEDIKIILERKYSNWQDDEKVKRRAIAFLQRRGYRYSDINKVMKFEEQFED